MKKLNIIILIFIFLVNSILANELKWVDEQIAAIKPPRKGISNKIINNLEDPFLFLIKNRKTISKKRNIRYNKYGTKQIYIKPSYNTKQKVNNPKFKLEAIINKTALINNRWYKIGEKIDRYTLKEMTKTKVVLLKGLRVIILTTNSENRTLKFINN